MTYIEELRATLADAQRALADTQSSLDRVSELLDEVETPTPDTEGGDFELPEHDVPFGGPDAEPA
jgi:uncharacterized coiled-coil protein SlyX